MPHYFRTLRFKIAGAFLLWTVVFQVAVALIIPVVREGYLIREVDQDLRQHAQAAASRLAMGHDPHELAATAATADSEEGVAQEAAILIQIATPDGRIVAASPRLRDGAGLPLPVPLAALDAPGPADPLFSTFKAQDGPQGNAEPGRLRVATVRVEGPPPPGSEQGPTYLLYTVHSLLAADTWGRALQWMLLAALIPGVLGAAGAGWIVAGSMAARIERVGRELRAISAAKLGERVELPGGEDEIGTLTADINSMLDRLASTFRGMEQFMSEVSHELKTPVAALLAEAQVMKYSAPTADEATKQFISGVEEEMRRLGKLVESFLMLARFEHGRRFVAEGVVSVNDVVLESVEHSTRMATQAGVNLSLTLHDPGVDDPEAAVHGDSELLRIAIDNLIRNAVQFSDRGSAVSIRVECEAAAQGGVVAISVRDRGPGSPPDYINRIFERYTQAPAQKAGRRGTGLGLAIAKGVVELHSGTIEAHNHPEGGCIFTIRVPMIRSAARFAAAAPAGVLSR